MKTSNILILALLITCNCAIAQDTLYIYKSGTVVLKSAINNIDSITFYNSTTSSGNSVTDIDGNLYHTVTIGTQVWMLENLKVTHYRNGLSIPEVTDNAGWSGLTSGACCWYNNDQASYKTDYGAFYNWYAVNDSHYLCPIGWHVPTDVEWNTLLNYLGGANVADQKLNETGTTHWQSNSNATNESGFTALPGGYRNNVGTFYFIGTQGNWWSSSEQNSLKSYSRSIDQLFGGVSRNVLSKNSGVSVRCIKD